MEGILYNVPKKPFLPYTRPTPTSYTSLNTQTTIKPYTSPNLRTLPGYYLHQNLLIIILLNLTITNQDLTTLTLYEQFSQNLNPTSQTCYKPTREEKKDIRRKGLCMWCGLKFTQGHQCIWSQLYQLFVAETTNNVGKIGEFLDCFESTEELTQEEENTTFVISLHVLWGTAGCQTMRVLGKIKNI